MLENYPNQFQHLNPGSLSRILALHNCQVDSYPSQTFAAMANNIRHQHKSQQFYTHDKHYEQQATAILITNPTNEQQQQQEQQQQHYSSTNTLIQQHPEIHQYQQPQQQQQHFSLLSTVQQEKQIYCQKEQHLLSRDIFNSTRKSTTNTNTINIETGKSFTIAAILGLSNGVVLSQHQTPHHYNEQHHSLQHPPHPYSPIYQQQQQQQQHHQQQHFDECKFTDKYNKAINLSLNGNGIEKESFLRQDEEMLQNIEKSPTYCEDDDNEVLDSDSYNHNTSNTNEYGDSTDLDYNGNQQPNNIAEQNENYDQTKAIVCSQDNSKSECFQIGNRRCQERCHSNSSSNSNSSFQSQEKRSISNSNPQKEETVPKRFPQGLEKKQAKRLMTEMLDYNQTVTQHLGQTYAEMVQHVSPTLKTSTITTSAEKITSSITSLQITPPPPQPTAPPPSLTSSASTATFRTAFCSLKSNFTPFLANSTLVHNRIHQHSHDAALIRGANGNLVTAAAVAAVTNAAGASNALQSLQDLQQHHTLTHNLNNSLSGVNYAREKFKNGISTNCSKKSTLKNKRVRTIFTPEQLERLETEFERQQYMVGPERLYLAHTLQLTEAQVKVWFQNRRIKWRKNHLELTQQRLAIFRQSQCLTTTNLTSTQRSLSQANNHCRSTMPNGANLEQVIESRGNNCGKDVMTLINSDDVTSTERDDKCGQNAAECIQDTDSEVSIGNDEDEDSLLDEDSNLVPDVVQT